MSKLRTTVHSSKTQSSRVQGEFLICLVSPQTSIDSNLKREYQLVNDMNRFVKLSSESWDVEIYGEKQVLLFTKLGRSSCSNVGLENESFQQTYSSTFLKVITQGTGKEVTLTFNTIYNSQVSSSVSAAGEIPTGAPRPNHPVSVEDADIWKWVFPAYQLGGAAAYHKIFGANGTLIQALDYQNKPIIQRNWLSCRWSNH